MAKHTITIAAKSGTPAATCTCGFAPRTRPGTKAGMARSDAAEHARHFASQGDTFTIVDTLPAAVTGPRAAECWCCGAPTRRGACTNPACGG